MSICASIINIAKSLKVWKYFIKKVYDGDYTSVLRRISLLTATIIYEG
jgi:hypothetical protein